MPAARARFKWSGGLRRLSVAWISVRAAASTPLEGMPSAIPGHNSVLVCSGCLLALVGWIGLNSAGALLFAGVEPGSGVLIAINTLLSAAAAASDGCGDHARPIWQSRTLR